MKVALYARYSSDNQRDASIEDQLRLCRARADRKSWKIVDSYTDRAIFRGVTFASGHSRIDRGWPQASALISS